MELPKIQTVSQSQVLSRMFLSRMTAKRYYKQDRGRRYGCEGQLFFLFCFCAELGVGASVFHVHCHALAGSSRPAQQLGLQALLHPDLPLPMPISWSGKCSRLWSEASFSLRRQAVGMAQTPVSSDRLLTISSIPYSLPCQVWAPTPHTPAPVTMHGQIPTGQAFIN